MSGMLDAGGSGGGGGSLDASDDPWADDSGTTDTSDDSGSTDSTDGTIEYTGGVDTGLTRATGDGGGGDVAANDPVNPSASPDTTDREAMTAEADQQQELIDSVQGDSPDNSQSGSSGNGGNGGNSSSNINKKALAGVALVGAAVLVRGS